MKKILLALLIIPFYGSTQTGTVTDIDGNVYKTIVIGDQTWMAENLKVSRYTNGKGIPNNIAFGWTCYNNDIKTNFKTYGLLYSDIMSTYQDPGNSGYEQLFICPVGWSIPTNDDYLKLFNYINEDSIFEAYATTDGFNLPASDTANKSFITVYTSTIAGNELKSIGTNYWNKTTSLVTNKTGFNAFGGGIGIYGGFQQLNYYGYFLTTTGYVKLSCYNSEAIMHTKYKNEFYSASVRCKQDTLMTEIEERTIKHSIKYYANPSISQLSIYSVENCNIQILDLAGRILKEQRVLVGDNTIDLNMPYGIYIIKVNDGNTTSNYKLFIDR